jgi:hypothetical protein
MIHYSILIPFIITVVAITRIMSRKPGDRDEIGDLFFALLYVLFLATWAGIFWW